MKLRSWDIVAACTMALAIAGSALAQGDKYPVKPIRWIVPFPPGGSTDVIARLVSPKLGEALGQQVVIDNRSGASGTIGTVLVARAAPDGYTVLSNTLPFVANPQLHSSPPYDILREFEPVMLIANQGSFLALHPSVPVRNVRELIALAKAKPGLLNYGTAGAGSNPHIAGELFNLMAKVNMVPVHFKGGGPVIIAIIGGEVAFSYLAIAGATQHIASGRMRAIAVTGTKREFALPDVPTVAESGLPGFEFSAWHWMMAPKGTPRSIIDTLNEKLKNVLRLPDIALRFRQEALEVMAGTPDELGTLLAAEIKKYAHLVKERGMRAE
ncbi:MAG: tripartite tricarboxylate transporter substrate binding protein [Pseudomonadota bacterium]